MWKAFAQVTSSEWVSPSPRLLSPAPCAGRLDEALGDQLLVLLPSVAALRLAQATAGTVSALCWWRHCTARLGRIVLGLCWTRATGWVRALLLGRWCHRWCHRWRHRWCHWGLTAPSPLGCGLVVTCGGLVVTCGGLPVAFPSSPFFHLEEGQRKTWFKQN